MFEGYDFALAVRERALTMALGITFLNEEGRNVSLSIPKALEAAAHFEAFLVDGAKE